MEEGILHVGKERKGRMGVVESTNVGKIRVARLVWLGSANRVSCCVLLYMGLNDYELNPVKGSWGRELTVEGGGAWGHCRCPDRLAAQSRARFFGMSTGSSYCVVTGSLWVSGGSVGGSTQKCCVSKKSCG